MALVMALSLCAFLLGNMVSTANAAALTYSSNANIYLSTPQLTLVIQAVSSADGLTVNAASVAVTLSAGETFTLTSPQSLSSSTVGSGGGLSQTCVSGTETEAIAQASGSETYTLTPAGSACVSHAPGSGGGGGGGATYSPSIAMGGTPASGASYTHGATVGLAWTPANGAFVKYKIYYSSDNGATWTTITDNLISASYSWTVPDASTVLGKIKVEGYDWDGNLLASATSNGNFTVLGTSAPPPITPPALTPPPVVDPNVTGTYDPATAEADTPDIATDLGLAAPPANTTVHWTAGTLIKGSLSAVYYCGMDGKRYVFVNSRVYFTWYPDFSGVQIIADTDLANIPLGGNITYRPGVKIIKIQTDPKVYAVARGGVLRWLSSEAVAARLYGVNWNKMIDYIPDAFFVNYKIGAPITE